MEAGRVKRQIIVAVLALCAASAMYWLSSEFRPSGVLGWLQVVLAPMFLLPHLAGVVFGGTVHTPNSATFALALFIQFFVLFSLLLLIWRRIRAR